ncbi:protein IQ-DOMAIN 14-like [Abrus precatorius]|uniref:Protein IQ-DOMAIN 14-like n=1 Tax=Abrus precatorius TaxID=3816 RepID=A0A8B8LAQ1_ABRPR|nr:protein IQ-DOMAIN 14-like [Abrus precatorius]
MGKAGKWIRNFLLGKREEKFKKIDACHPENKAINMGSQIVNPKVKRKWSFGKLTGGKITSKVSGHKFSRSFDSGDSAKLQIQTLLETQTPRILSTALAKVCEDTEFETTAATKIQAAFRSYLARKALYALRGLVKLQALVRGHLVRKQTTTTMRGMHALMAIQVRARIQRIQMAEEANLLWKQPMQHREMPHLKDLITEENKDSGDMSLEEMLEVWKSRSGPLDGSHDKRGHDSMTYYSKHLPVSRRENQHKNALLAESNSQGNYRDMSEFNLTTMALSTSQRHPVPHRQSWSPNYMNKTESSRAKARSHSEPKQRPRWGMRHKSKSVESPRNGPRQNLFSNSLRFDHGNQDHCVISLHGSMKDSKRDSFGSSTGTVTSDSYY